jgi:hypothetical protein
MTIQQALSNFELIATLTQKRIRNLAIERAWELATMAARGECPDERFSDKECEVWNNYRFWVEVLINETRQNRDLA